MKPVQHTIRLPIALDTALRALAERDDISVYEMLQRSVKTGVSTLANPPQPDSEVNDMIGEVASISLAMVGIERMLDRALFTSCAAYCYARSAAQGARKTDEAITAEITAAYGRARLVFAHSRRRRYDAETYHPTCVAVAEFGRL